MRKRGVASILMNGLGVSAGAVALSALAVALCAVPAAARDESARDAELQPERVMDAIGVGPGMVVGEPGAGQGYFTLKLARRVGAAGKVYANDIDASALEALRERCRQEGVRNVETVQGAVADPRFPAGTLDLVIMVYALHDFAEPQAFLEALKASLKARAPVVILDRDPEQTGERHFLPRERLLALFAASGYVLTREERFVENHVLLIFRVA